MNTSEHPIFTVVGIRKSQGDFIGEGGKKIEFSNTVVTVLTDFSDYEKQQGAIGHKAVDYKIKGAQFFNDYVQQRLPAQAKLIFNWDFSGNTPRAILMSLDFDIE